MMFQVMPGKMELMTEQVQQLKKISSKLDDLRDIKTSLAMLVKLLTNKTEESHDTVTETVHHMDEYVTNFIEVIKAEKQANQIKQDAYKFRKAHYWEWSQIVNKRKLAYYNNKVCKDTAVIYSDFITSEPPFIPRKYLIKPPNQEETARQEQRRLEQCVSKVEDEIDILKEKCAKYESLMTESEAKIKALIQKGPTIEVRQKLIELWNEEISDQEIKSDHILLKKKTWLESLPQREKEEDQSANTSGSKPRRFQQQSYSSAVRSQQQSYTSAAQTTPRQINMRAGSTGNQRQHNNDNQRPPVQTQNRPRPNTRRQYHYQCQLRQEREVRDINEDDLYSLDPLEEIHENQNYSQR